MKLFWIFHLFPIVIILVIGGYISFHEPDKAFYILLPPILPLSSFIMAYGAAQWVLRHCKMAVESKNIPMDTILSKPITRDMLNLLYLMGVFLCAAAILQRAYTDSSGGNIMNFILIVTFSLIPVQGIIIMVEYLKFRSRHF